MSHRGKFEITRPKTLPGDLSGGVFFRGAKLWPGARRPPAKKCCIVAPLLFTQLCTTITLVIKSPYQIQPLYRLAVSSSFVELLPHKFACTAGSVPAKINALVQPCVERFCELVRFKSRMCKTFFAGLNRLIFRHGCKVLNCGCKSGKVNDQQENNFASPSPHNRLSPFRAHFIGRAPTAFHIGL